MKKEFTCNELYTKLGIRPEKIIPYLQLLQISSIDEIDASYVFSQAQTRLIINIIGYEKLGYNYQTITKMLTTHASHHQNVQKSIIKDIIGLVPAVIITKDEDNNTLLKNNSLASSLDSFLENDSNLSVINIAKRLSINITDIDKIIEHQKVCKESDKRCDFYAHGILDDRFFHFRITSIKSVDSYDRELISTIFSDFTEQYLAQKNISDNSVGFHNTIDQIPFPILILEADTIA